MNEDQINAEFTRAETDCFETLNSSYEQILNLRGYFTFPLLLENGFVRRYGRGRVDRIIPIKDGVYLVVSGGGAALYEIGFKNPFWEFDIPVSCGALSKDMTKLALAWNNVIFLHTFDNGIKFYELKGPKGRLLSIDFSPDGNYLAAGGSDNEIYLWDTRTFREFAILEGHEDFINQISFSPNGNLLASSGEDASIRIWDYRKSTQLKCIKNPNNMPFEFLDFFPDGELLLSAGKDATVYFIKPRSGEIIETYKDADPNYPAYFFTGVALDPIGRYLAISGGNLYKIKIIDLKLKEEIEMFGHTNAVRDLQFGRTKPFLFSASIDNSVRIWDLLGYSETIRSYPYTSGVYSIGLNDDFSILATGGFDKKVHIWDIASGQQLESLNLENKVPIMTGSIAFLPRKNIVTIIGDRKVFFWDLEPAVEEKVDEKIRGFSLNISFVNTFFLDPKGDRFVIAGWNTDDPKTNIISMYKIQSGDLIWERECNSLVLAVTISQNRQYIAFGGKDRIIHLVEFDTGQEIKQIAGHDDTINGLAFNSRNKILASASSDGTVRIWDLDSGEQKHQLGPFLASFSRVTFSPNGKYCAFGTHMGQLGIWETASEKNFRIIRAHASPITCIDFSPDDQLLFSGSSDGTVRSWEYKRLKGFEDKST